ASSFAAMTPQSISAVGGSQPHTNFQPYLCVNFIISLYGISQAQLNSGLPGVRFTSGCEANQTHRI
ncbi:MAG TPA: hypothetical protein PL157_10625, partial [Acidobacteriota bacterium]|nr:hypothetical protein [Acidobacteriota bacterium]